MIAVIADDFTGAAELGGLGLRYGMSVEIETEVIDDCSADLLIIATDTRSMTKEQASQENYNIIKALEVINPDWIYKKTDSVLRGHILEELVSIIKASHIEKVLLVPANPSFGRTISEGQYFINNKPLHKTGFSEDPEFALSSSNVLKILGDSETIDTVVLKDEAKFPEQGVIIGEAENDSDLTKWALKVKENILPAGAAGFFAALLEQNGYLAKKNYDAKLMKLGKIRLYVCGSSFTLSRNTVEDAKKEGRIVCEMPDDLFSGKGNSEVILTKWTSEITEYFKSHNSIIVAINQPIILKDGFAKRLREITALIVKGVLENVPVEELFIEGGATTSAIVRMLNFKKFVPVQEVAPGVIRMQVKDKTNMFITLKPGSYLWPSKIWQIE